ncbi:MAG: hypothetical protein HUU20_12185 [Pirellulales bacterium]|nr:hypothetical protein [Pirellulales bacterium]
MQLDHTRIAIRERGYLEILDLALHVVPAQGKPLLAWLAAGIVPCAVVNHWLLAGYLETELDMVFPAGYVFFMLLLAFWEVPLATAPATLYLGHAMFRETAERRKIARELLESLPQLFFYQVLLRPVFAWTRPFLNEVILLERNPMRSQSGSSRSTSQRSKTFHGGESDPFGRWLGGLTFGGTLFAAIWASAYILRSILVGDWNWHLSMVTVYFPLALWTVAAYLAVVRFLSYLDLRIRREGWEVELMMRAEAARLTRAWR